MGRYEIFVTEEDGISCVWCPEISVSGSGLTVDAAETAFVIAVAEYAADWVNGLALVAEYRRHVLFVRMVTACRGDIDSLRALLLGCQDVEQPVASSSRAG